MSSSLPFYMPLLLFLSLVLSSVVVVTEATFHRVVPQNQEEHQQQNYFRTSGGGSGVESPPSTTTSSSFSASFEGKQEYYAQQQEYQDMNANANSVNVAGITSDVGESCEYYYCKTGLTCDKSNYKCRYSKEGEYCYISAVWAWNYECDFSARLTCLNEKCLVVDKFNTESCAKDYEKCILGSFCDGSTKKCRYPESKRGEQCDYYPPDGTHSVIDGPKPCEAGTTCKEISDPGWQGRIFECL